MVLPSCWLDRVNEHERRIIRAYETLGGGLDTVALQDREHFTLYFP